MRFDALNVEVDAVVGVGVVVVVKGLAATASRLSKL
jgi:hypothetical protein